MKYTASDYGKNIKKITEGAQRFRGINVDDSCARDELRHSVNLVKAASSLKTRESRGIIRTLTSADGIHADDTVAYVDSGRLYYGGYEVPGVYLTLGKKEMHRIGNYLLVYPDGVFVNLEDTSDNGYLASTYNTSGTVLVTCVDSSYDKIEYTSCETEPEEAVVGQYCTVKDENGKWVAKRYDGTRWVGVKTYIKIRSMGISTAFRKGDLLLCTQFEGIGLGMFRVVRSFSESLYVEGALAANANFGKITVTRYMPIFDYTAVCGDRLVGVRRGVDTSGSYVCKMYASAVNDPFNFLPEAGGAEIRLNVSGAFTGLGEYLGSPIAFTENEIIEGRFKGNALLATVIKTDGVQSGAHKSIVCADGKLYYKSKGGVFEYDGAYPECISAPIGVIGASADGTPAGFIKGKYYIKLTDNESQSAIYVYDVERREWYSQDDPGVTEFACRGSNIYALCGGEDGGALVLLDYDSASEDEKAYLSDEGYPIRESDIAWEFESRDIGIDGFSGACPIRAVLRLKKSKGSTVRVDVIYDGEEIPERGVTVDVAAGGSVSLPIPLRRCDYLRLKVSGAGECEILGYAVELHKGGMAYGWK